MALYNYAAFVMADEEPVFEAFPGHLSVGGRAPDGPVEDLDGGDRMLGDLWSDGPAILEFGSFT